MGIFVKKFSLIFPLFSPMWGKLISPPGSFVSSLERHNSSISPNFPQISLQFPLNSPQIHPISKFFLLIPPDSPVSCAVFNTTSQVYFVSEHQNRPTGILCILHVSSKMRIPHYARQRIINLGNSGEIQGIQGNSGEFFGNQMKSFSFFFTRFPRCEIHFPLGEIYFP